MSRRRYASGASVVLAAAAIVVLVIAPWRPVVRHAAATPTPPVGTQWVSFHGITLTVPAAWEVGTFACTNPDRSAVQIADWSGMSCPGPEHPPTPADATVVTLGDLSTRTPEGDLTTVAGQPALRFVYPGGEGGRPALQYQLLTPGVVVEIRGPGMRDPDILAGLRYTPLDANGCHATLAADPIPATTPAGRIALPTPTSVTVCDYAPRWTGRGGWLFGSRTLTADEGSAFVRSVDSAPPWAEPPDIYGQLQGDDLLYRLALPDGSTRTLAAQAIGGTFAVSDGTVRVAIPYVTHVPAAWR